MLNAISPDSLEPIVALGLIVLAGFTSFITAAMGLGGGMLLLIVMASTLPIAALIPVHGLVQLGSNASRSIMTIKHLDWSMFAYFAVGSILGAGLASLVLVQLPLNIIQFAIAIFLLFIIWGGRPKRKEHSAIGSSIAGLITTFLSMVVGASGPMVASVVYRNAYSKLTHTATFASCMSFQHSLKALVFVSVGFAFWEWLPLVTAMIISGAIGTWLGLQLLNKIPTKKFMWWFKIIISVLAIRLLYQSFVSTFQ